MDKKTERVLDRIEDKSLCTLLGRYVPKEYKEEWKKIFKEKAWKKHSPCATDEKTSKVIDILKSEEGLEKIIKNEKLVSTKWYETYSKYPNIKTNALDYALLLSLAIPIGYSVYIGASNHILERIVALPLSISVFALMFLHWHPKLASKIEVKEDHSSYEVIEPSKMIPLTFARISHTIIRNGRKAVYKKKIKKLTNEIKNVFHDENINQEELERIRYQNIELDEKKLTRMFKKRDKKFIETMNTLSKLNREKHEQEILKFNKLGFKQAKKADLYSGELKNILTYSKKLGLDTKTMNEKIRERKNIDLFAKQDQELPTKISKLGEKEPEKALDLLKALEQKTEKYVKTKILSTDFEKLESIKQCIEDTKQFLDYANKIGVKADGANSLYKELIKIGKQKTQIWYKKSKKFFREMEN